MLPEHLKDDAITRTWETCSATVGAKVFNDIQFKKTIVKNKTRIRKIKSDIASGKFIRDDPTGMKEKTANRELKTLEDGIKNARLGLEDKTPDGRPLYNEQGDVVSTKFSKEDLKTFSPMMY